jgi:hypothetical protein
VIFDALGLRLLRDALGRERAMLHAALLAILGLGVNAVWLVKAAEEIHRGYHHYPLSGLLGYLDQHPTTDFAPSPRMRRRLARIGTLNRPNLVPVAELGRSASPALGVVQWRDLGEWSPTGLCLVGANRPGVNIWPDPAYEVNRDYYPTFSADRVVIVPSDVARRIRIFGGPAVDD